MIPNESLRAWRLYGPGTEQPSGWPTYDQWVARMQALVTNYPNLVRMVSIGQSVQGRELWMLKLTDKPDVEEDEPEFRYVSTMHGTEPVGAELCLRLAELLTGAGHELQMRKLGDLQDIELKKVQALHGLDKDKFLTQHQAERRRAQRQSPKHSTKERPSTLNDIGPSDDSEFLASNHQHIERIPHGREDGPKRQQPEQVGPGQRPR